MKRIALFLSVFLFLIIAFNCPKAFAETKTFEREYTYQASEADSKLTSRAIALEQVKRLLLEELGTYLESQTEVESLQITKDQILNLSAGVVQTIILDETWDGKVYWMKAKIDVDPDKVISDLDNLRKDRQKAQEYESLKKQADEALLQIEELKKELAQTSEEKGRKKIKSDYENKANILTANDWTADGWRYYGLKEYKKSIESFNKSIQTDTKYMGAYIGIYSAAKEIADLKLGIDTINKAIEDHPNNANIYVGRGIFCKLAGDDEQAEEDFSRAIALDPYNVRAYKERGKIHSSNKYDLDRARQDMSLAIQYGLKDADAYMERGKINTLLGHYDNAMDDYKTSLEINPKLTNSYAYYNDLGDVYRSAEEYENAIHYYNFALTQVKLETDYQDPQEHDAAIALLYKQIGNVYQKTGNYQQAINEYSEALKIAPEKRVLSLVLQERGHSYLSLNNDDKAMQDFNDSIKTRPNAFAYEGRADLYVKHGKYDQAIDDYSKAIEKYTDTNQSVCYYKRAIIHKKLGNKNKYLFDMKTAATLKNRDAQEWLIKNEESW
ncbi:MAG: tetratricopeptide repeat protein [Candidatus Saganbacteria bacterium]|nr:tetratricopeptide repeat protein [Candidatus Saganbacteria bacterium]